MNRKKKLVVVGDSTFAQIAYEYFEHDSDYHVVAFSVERGFLRRARLFDLPVVPFEDLDRLYPPPEHSTFVAIVFTQFNRLRTRLYRECKAKGYAMASYISSAAVIRPKIRIGEHCFICEGSVIQPFTEVRNNVVIWSGTQICHRCVVQDNSFILPNSIISDGVVIGKNCIIGANVTFTSDLKIGSNCFIGPAVLLTEDVPDSSIIERTPTGIAPEIPVESVTA